MSERPDPERDDSRRPRSFITPIIIVGVVLLVVVLLGQQMGAPAGAPKNLSDLDKDVLDGKIERVVIGEDGSTEVFYKTNSGPKTPEGREIRSYEIAAPRDYFDEKAIAKIKTGEVDKFDRLNDDQKKKARDNAPNVEFAQPRGLLMTILISWLPWLLLLVFLYWLFMRQLRNSAMGGGVLSFGKSRAVRSDPKEVLVTFEDVAGIDEAKEEVQEIIEFLKNPSKFQRLGGRIPRGVMLVGAPGTGKTLLAKAIAGEAGVPFFPISGSDFVEMFVGVGASRVRDLFKQAKDNSPCIVFLDEIDAVGRKRGTGFGGGHDEREQTLNAILVEMDGFKRDEGIIVVAATNRPDVLDPALLRPGRFDREVMIDLPDVKGREAILKVHSKKVKVSTDVDLSVIARATPMFSGAELEALINEAAILATMRNKDSVEMTDVEEARDKVRWGRQKKSRVMAEEDRKRTAYHEAGHALLATLHEDVEPLHKVTIIPRGMALGATMILPEKDRYTYSRKQAAGDLIVLYGGYVVEQVFFDDITSGAKNDIENATRIARLMVTEWGMSEKLGPINYSETYEHQFLGREFSGPKEYSEATAQVIDSEIQRIINEAKTEATRVITENRDALERVASALLKYESLSGKEVEDIVKGVSIEDLRKNNNHAAFSTDGGAKTPSAPQEPGAAPSKDAGLNVKG
jgi:cell division protease FtsH